MTCYEAVDAFSSIVVNSRSHDVWFDGRGTRLEPLEFEAFTVLWRARGRLDRLQAHPQTIARLRAKLLRTRLAVVVSPRHGHFLRIIERRPR